jgi:beta-glucosidase
MRSGFLAAAGIAATLAFASAFGQSGDFTPTGTVIDASGTPIPMATVTYTSVAKRLSFDFSRSDGSFGISTGVLPFPKTNNARISLFSAGPVTMDIFDMTGKKVRSVHMENIDKGTYIIEPGRAGLSNAMYVLKITAGKSVMYRKLLNTKTGIRVAGANSISGSKTDLLLTKKLAAIDTIRIGKTGYKPEKVEISSYRDDVGSVTLAVNNIDSLVDTLFAQMTQTEKVGQCAMPVNTAITTATAASQTVGSIFGGGGAFTSFTPATLATWCDGFQTAMQGSPKKVPLMIAYDGVHGMCVMPGGTILPHNLGMGAIQDSTLIEKAFRVAALEIRATGANWTFGPCVAVPRDDRWGRTYEGFAETPARTAQMARYAILGLQTSDLSLPWAIAATTKHFAGDGGTINGMNPGYTSGTDSADRAIHLAGYTSAIQAGTACVMPSLSSWPNPGATEAWTAMHCNAALLTDWLKTQQGFSGFVVGDWEGHSQCAGGVSANGIAPSMNDGLDVPMAPSLGTVVGNIPFNDRTQDACKRVLRIKYRMDLFNQYLTDQNIIPLVGCAEHRAVARACVRNSLVLLKNANSALPLAKTSRVALWGTGADNIGIQCGAWTASDSAGGLTAWQGSTKAHWLAGTTILQGIDTICQGQGTVTYSANGDSTASALADIDCIIAVLSENPYAETHFTTISLTNSFAASGNPTGINFATASNAPVIANIAKAHNAGKKVVVVLMAGRPLDISTVIGNCDAFVWACLPGTEGRGIGEVLFQDQGYGFSGKLPVSWPGNSTNYAPVTGGAMFAAGAGLFPY